MIDSQLLTSQALVKGFSYGPVFWAFWILVGSVLEATILYMVYNFRIPVQGPI